MDQVSKRKGAVRIDSQRALKSDDRLRQTLQVAQHETANSVHLRVAWRHSQGHIAVGQSRLVIPHFNQHGTARSARLGVVGPKNKRAIEATQGLVAALARHQRIGFAKQALGKSGLERQR